ncbi:hypothetical protein DICPUDRAFT_152710 [Dictyostelium purpureum]|uniref:Uncharacterized protein n=1 Tax=Dictyostelium purpureum TaxID=5786 RepID=F0ZM33_DICPU|nr:uncharacterized protein DICPUDRAFT_152710 [Dictyostelium purpureum]EGC35006.1 hypothetical protein DICPUDRAFT_152710 [Dictyostelium purpureum]|eukprot:XP_003288480.1 hypothetical protein DICPUDRAFT_152710 [Dictyostelium purpureum]
MVKEAFLAAVSNKKIVFLVAADEKFRPKICNTNDVFTAKLETLLPHKAPTL